MNCLFTALNIFRLHSYCITIKLQNKAVQYFALGQKASSSSREFGKRDLFAIRAILLTHKRRRGGGGGAGGGRRLVRAEGGDWEGGRVSLLHFEAIRARLSGRCLLYSGSICGGCGVTVRV